MFYVDKGKCLGYKFYYLRINVEIANNISPIILAKLAANLDGYFEIMIKNFNGYKKDNTIYFEDINEVNNAADYINSIVLMEKLKSF